jgi:hypothetical protein
MIASTLMAYLAIYALLIAAYVSVLFHLAGKGLKAVASPSGAGVSKSGSGKSVGDRGGGYAQPAGATAQAK